MSVIRCSDCNASFEGLSLACCPSCLAARWLATERLVRDKHDPSAPPSRLETYRSILTPRTKAELGEVLHYAAQHGSWYQDLDYGMWVHVTPEPLGRLPGVGIPAGKQAAEHALDCLFIAEADSPDEAHVFAVAGQRHEDQVRAGVFVPLGECGQAECENLLLPGFSRCAAHEGKFLPPGGEPEDDGR